VRPELAALAELVALAELAMRADGMTAEPGATGQADAVAGGQPSVAVVGLACRYPDADDSAAMLDLVTTGRRAFRRIPPGQRSPAGLDPARRPRAALIGHWESRTTAPHVGRDPARPESPPEKETPADPASPAVTLALETSARALAAAGLDDGRDLPAGRSAVVLGCRSAAAVARRAQATRADQAQRAAARCLAPFAAVAAGPPDDGAPGTVAARLARRLGLAGIGLDVTAGGASSLAAVAAACAELASGDIDLAVAGGVEVGIDGLDLAVLAGPGLLAAGDMRIYDKNPTGFLPGEGCGMVLLMRSADAAAAGLPVYAEILGWGLASAAVPGQGPARQHQTPHRSPHQSQHPPAAGATVTASHLAAMRAAYEMARLDPAEIELFEGCGTAVPVTDEAELAALGSLRTSTGRPAALGAVSANIGSAGAAAGAAGLIKAVLAVANGVLPPSTGIRTPHPLLADPSSGLRTLPAAEPWSAGTRHAGVSASGPGDLAVHLVLRGGSWRSPTERAARGRVLVRVPGKTRTRTRTGARARARTRPAPEPGAWAARTPPAGTYPAASHYPFCYLIRAADRAEAGTVLARIAQIAPWLSDGQMQDLAVHLAGAAAQAPESAPGHQVRVAIVAAGQDRLAEAASEAAALLPELSAGTLTTRPGIAAMDDAEGDERNPNAPVALLLASQPGNADLPQRELSRILAVLGRLDELGVQAAAAAGHGIGELASLVWADCASPADARALLALRSAALAAPASTWPGQLSMVMDEIAQFPFGQPRRRLLSGSLGTEVSEPGAIADMLSAEMLGARLGAAAPPGGRLSAAVRAAVAGAGLLLQTGIDRQLAAAVGTVGPIPVISIDADPADDRQVVLAAATLFAAGALTRPGALYAGRPSRPIDIWGEQISPPDAGRARRGEPADSAKPEQASAGLADAGQAHAGQADAVQAGAAPAAAPTATSKPFPASPSPRSEPARLAAGTARWARCYAERVRPLADRLPVEVDRPWRVQTGGCEPLRMEVGELFIDDPEADRTLAVLGTLDDTATRAAALMAAQDAIGTGRLVAISPGPELAGFWATLHAEHRDLGITVVRAPLTSEGLRAARAVAAAVPGELRELVIGADGAVGEPVMAPAALTGGAEFPFGPKDVVLISRGSGAAGLALAQVLACSGAAVALIGRRHRLGDAGIIAELERLRAAGARVSYEVVDMTDHGAMVGAVTRIESRLGRVTALSHATDPTTHLAIAELTHADVHEVLRRQVAALDQMAAAVRAAERTTLRRPNKLRLIVTFGSVIGRYGLAGEGMLALATGALAEHGRQLARASAGCRALHVDWPVWAGAGLGERADLAAACRAAGFAALPLSEGTRLLLKLLATDGLPDRLAVHGRVGVPAPTAVAARQADGGLAAGRFVERVLVHYPDAELIVEATLSLRTDPYLADYCPDGVPVLAPTMALEAMAQAAAVLAGRPLRTASGLTTAAPVVLPSGGAATVLRIRALRDADAVTVTLRSDNSDFAVDHCTARFSAEPFSAEPFSAEPLIPRQQSADLVPGGLLAGLGDPAAIGSRPPGSERHGSVRHGSELRGSELYGADLYGADLYSGEMGGPEPVCFQAGRFRRLTLVHQVGSRSASALADGRDHLAWFGAGAADDQSAAGLVLGSPGLSDATLQLVQACVPHRRLALAGCESVAWSGRVPVGPVTIRAAQAEPPVEAGTPGRPIVARALVPRQAGPASAEAETARTETAGTETAGTETASIETAAGETVWDVQATDSTGQPLVTWRGLRMRDAGPLPHAGPWPVPLLGSYLERAATDLGLGPGLRVQVGRDAAAGTEPTAGLTLRVWARGPAAAAWHQASLADVELAAAGAGHGQGWLTLLAALPTRAAQLSAARPASAADQQAASMVTMQARAAQAAALAACLRRDDPPPDLAVSVRYVVDVEWLVLRTAGAVVACTVLDAAGIGQVAFALMTEVATAPQPAEADLASKSPRLTSPQNAS